MTSVSLYGPVYVVTGLGRFLVMTAQSMQTFTAGLEAISSDQLALERFPLHSLSFPTAGDETKNKFSTWEEEEEMMEEEEEEEGEEEGAN